MDDNERSEHIAKFSAKLQKVIDVLDKHESNCLVCEKKTYRHVAIFGSSGDGSDLGFGAPDIGFRYAIAPICEEHDLSDEEVNRQVGIALEIKQTMDNKKMLHLGDINKVIKDDDIEMEE